MKTGVSEINMKDSWKIQSKGHRNQLDIRNGGEEKIKSSLQNFTWARKEIVVAFTGII